MKKKGFTLIELLAVIVILAIIALIATPIVMNVIENSRKGAAERSYENYVRTVETAIAAERIDGPVADGTYQVQADGSLCLASGCTEDTKIELEVNGTKPATGSTVEIRDGQVVKGENTTLTLGDYTVKYDTATNKVVATKVSGTTTKICTYDTSSTVTKGEIGAKYNCTVAENDTKQFYLIEIGGTGLTKKDRDSVQYSSESAGTADSGEVALIMTENIDEGTTKFEESDELKGPLTALAYLDARTTNWREDIQTFLPTYGQYSNISEKSNTSQLIKDTNYWLSSLFNEGQPDPVTCVVKDEGYNLCGRNGQELGVRPVITIPAEQCEL